MRTPFLLLIAASLVVPGCSDETPSEPPAGQSAPQASSSARPDIAALPPIPEIEYDRINEEPVRAELREYRERALKNPTSAQAAGELGMKCFVYDFDEESLASFERAAALAPDSLQWAYYLAMSHESAVETDRAIQWYERAIEIDPSYQPAYVRLAMIMLDIDRERACTLFDQADRLMPNEARATWGLAQCTRLSGDLGYAEQLYRDTIKLEPMYADAHFGLAQILVQTDRREQAKLHFALQSAGRTPSDYRDRLAVQLALAERGTAGIIRDATSLLRQGQTDRAAALITQSFERYPDHTALLLQLAQVRIAQQNFELAKEHLSRVLVAVPGNVGAGSMLAYISLLESDFQSAETKFREVLADAPDDAVSNWYLGRVLLQLGRPDEAIPFLARGADLQMFKPDVQQFMANLSESRGEPGVAATYAQRAAIAGQGDPGLTATAARLRALADEQGPQPDER